MRRGEDLTKQMLSKRAPDPRVEKDVPPNVPPRKRGFSEINLDDRRRKPRCLLEVFIDLQNFVGRLGIGRWRRERDSNPRYPLG
jgi:hypothetical protein